MTQKNKILRNFKKQKLIFKFKKNIIAFQTLNIITINDTSYWKIYDRKRTFGINSLRKSDGEYK